MSDLQFMAVDPKTNKLYYDEETCDISPLLIKSILNHELLHLSRDYKAPGSYWEFLQVLKKVYQKIQEDSDGYTLNAVQNTQQLYYNFKVNYVYRNEQKVYRYWEFAKLIYYNSYKELIEESDKNEDELQSILSRISYYLHTGEFFDNFDEVIPGLYSDEERFTNVCKHLSTMLVTNSSSNITSVSYWNDSQNIVNLHKYLIKLITKIDQQNTKDSIEGEGEGEGKSDNKEESDNKEGENKSKKEEEEKEKRIEEALRKMLREVVKKLTEKDISDKNIKKMKEQSIKDEIEVIKKSNERSIFH
ncbi:MAG: hypothetical protein ACTSWZ_03455, partial [Candidatus Heimdallarchaeaceae archaeon]